MKKNFGLLGGSFNPIHCGHIEIAKHVLNFFNMEKIFFVPANISPFKNSDMETNKYHRFEMLKLALKKYPEFLISDFELKKKGRSFTIDTIRFFKEKYPNYNLYLIMGEDSFASIKDWNSYKEIFSLVNIIVYPRESYNFENTIKLFKNFKKIKADKNISQYSSLNENYIFFLKLPHLKYSSTNVRSTLKNNGYYSNMVPPEVAKYIEKYKLYKEE